METLSRVDRTAAKRHHCDWCNGAIEVGEKYTVSAITDGGDFWTWKEHPSCRDLFDTFAARGDFAGLHPEEITADTFQESVYQFAADECELEGSPGRYAEWSRSLAVAKERLLSPPPSSSPTNP